MLQYIEIEKFKNIEQLGCWLGNINILIGANNSGKSSILQAIQFAVSVAQSTKSLGAKWKIAQKRCPSSLSSNNLIYTPLRDIEALAPKGKLETTLASAIRMRFYACDKQAEVIVRKGKNRNISTDIKGLELGKELQEIKKPYSIIVPGLAGISPYEEFKSESLIRKAAAKGDANNYFRNILLLLSKNDQSWNKFIDKFNIIFPEHSININFDQSLDDIIHVEIVNNGYKLPIDSCGTGMLQIIQILSYYYLYKPKLLILDEPDSHLHPDNQKQLAKIIKLISLENKCQIIISTHSRNILDSLKYDSEIHWIKNGQIVEGEEVERDILMDIGALGAGDRLQNGDIRYIILTEDNETDNIRALCLSSGFNDNEIDIWSYNGCAQINVALALNSFINKHAPGTRVILHRDRDYMTDEECTNFINKFEGSGLDIFVTKGNDTEWHFIHPQHINSLYPALSIERIEQLIEEVITEQEEKIIEKFINTIHNRKLKLSYKGGDKPNAGQIATTCRSLFIDNPRQYMHGKIVARNLRNKIQHEVGGDINFFVPSEFIQDETLLEFSTPNE